MYLNISIDLLVLLSQTWKNLNGKIWSNTKIKFYARIPRKVQHDFYNKHIHMKTQYISSTWAYRRVNMFNVESRHLFIRLIKRSGMLRRAGIAIGPRMRRRSTSWQLRDKHWRSSWAPGRLRFQRFKCLLKKHSCSCSRGFISRLYACPRVRDAVRMAAERRRGASVHGGGDGLHKVASVPLKPAGTASPH